jgi:hypothetical protein
MALTMDHSCVVSEFLENDLRPTMVVDLQASSEIDHFSTSFFNKAIVNNANFWDNFGAKDQASRSFRDWIQSASASDALNLPPSAV